LNGDPGSDKGRSYGRSGRSWAAGRLDAINGGRRFGGGLGDRAGKPLNRIAADAAGCAGLGACPRGQPGPANRWRGGIVRTVRLLVGRGALMGVAGCKARNKKPGQGPRRCGLINEVVGSIEGRLVPAAKGVDFFQGQTPRVGRFGKAVGDKKGYRSPVAPPSTPAWFAGEGLPAFPGTTRA